MKDILKAVVFGCAFAVPFLTLYIANDMFFPFITGKNFWFRILVEIGFSAWVALALYDRTYRPKFSWILGSFGLLLIVMFFANLFGEYPQKSFWSNFERMDGYVTLVHVFLYFVLLGSILTTKKLWSYFLHTTIGVAFLVSLYGLAQFGGLVAGSVRIDSTLGNAAYMAIYTLFHTFIALWLFVESKIPLQRLVYGLLAAMFIFTLIQTGTRGTAIGLAAGLVVTTAYIGIFGARFKEVRTAAAGLFVVLLLAGGTFIAVRDSDFVQGNPVLGRIANISIDDLTVRFTIWGMAREGIAERPILGWGQGNFNYVFNEQYDPFLYNQEQWFDRVHNIFFDWLIAGGILGFLAYFGIFFACLYYLLWRPVFNQDDRFDVLERGVVIGLLAGYVTHNLVVFDNLISYIFFAVILAFIHARVAKDIPSIANYKIDERLITQFATPVLIVAAGAIIYFVNVPGMQAAHDIIDAFRASEPRARLEAFDQAIRRDSFATQEIVEQLAQQAMNIAGNPNISDDVKQLFLQRSELEMLKLIEEKPGDARVHVFMASYYRAINALPQAKEQMAIARALSPNKQSIIIQQGLIEFAAGDTAAATAFFKEALDLEPKNREAREFYTGMLLLAGDNETAMSIIMEYPADIARMARNNFFVNAVNTAGENELLAELYEAKVALNPEDAQNWASLAYIYYELGDLANATNTLEEAKGAVAGFDSRAECFIDNINAGNEPGAGC